MQSLKTLFLVVLIALAAGGQASHAIDFSRQVQPILSNYCYACHGPDDQARQAELRLDDREAAFQVLPSGERAIVPGRLDQSELWRRLSHADPDMAMPPEDVAKHPTAEERAILQRWIEEGAPYAVHWAYVPPTRPEWAEVRNAAWPRSPIDRFVLAKLEQQGLSPSPPADRLTLLRRAALDLTGLPPSAEEVERFRNDFAPGAYERAVDRLLANPSYGERWASMWLDLARYGDSSGYIHDPPRTIWRWRDWLVRSLNDNVPYDRFTIEMLAGDLLPMATDQQRIATGFHRNTTTNTEGGANAGEHHFASVVDRVNTTMQVWMGTSFACAQCHNHKYDPFTQQEYFQLFAIFNNTVDFNSEDPKIVVPRVGYEGEHRTLAAQLAEAKRNLDEETARIDAEFGVWQQAVDRGELPGEIVDALALPVDQRTEAQIAALTVYHRSTSAEWTRRDLEVKRLQEAFDEVSATTLVMQEGAPRATRIAIRGAFSNWGEEVRPGVPAVFHPPPETPTLNRLDLARWLTDSKNPLTARVAVNRIWQEIFGVGLVETSEEFGIQGEPPSHGEMLDWLAIEYVRSGWDTKHIIKKIVLSATYRQASHATSELLELDPQNRLLARGPRHRLPAEAIRDQALAVSGLLSSKMYGPPVHPYQPANGLSAAFGPSTDWATSPWVDAHRRALYTEWRRNLPYPSMITFDVPERAACSSRRISTNTPIQALVTLNDPVFVEAAQALARRILLEGGATVQSRAEFAVRTVQCRPADDAEVHRLVELFEAARVSLAADTPSTLSLATKPLGALPEGLDAVDAAAWTVVGNVLLNLDETLAPY